MLLQCAADNAPEAIAQAKQKMRDKAEREGYQLGEISIEYNQGKAWLHAEAHRQCQTRA